ncbi:MAG: biotin synthase BioB [Planctomycetia bacterium]|nr:biotin synthase BioB [Planctomycetia bacterium]
MIDLEILGNELLAGKSVSRREAIDLYKMPLKALCSKSDEIRKHFCSTGFDLCTIINGKSGKCSENCVFCAQSVSYHTGIAEYPLLSVEEIVAQAKLNEEQGVLRYSIVTSCKYLCDREVEIMCQAVRRIQKETRISVCVSFGLLKVDQYRKLKEAGVTRIHNNLETSRRFFHKICTTHTYDEKIVAIRAAQKAGLSVCSGGIVGLGETPEDRIDLALALRELGIKSVPINILNPIPGTPLAENTRLTSEDIRRIVAVYRFILPDAAIRLAGGRGLLADKGKSCFASGANAAISGVMLTTDGISIATDKAMLNELGYELKRDHE